MKSKFFLLKWAALFEGTSFLALLFIAMPLKYWAEIPMAVKVVAPVHGTLVLVFFGLLLFNYLKNKISLVDSVLGIIAAFLPFGTFIFKAKRLK